MERASYWALTRRFWQDPTIRADIIQAYAQSISYIWLVMTPIIGACFILGEWIFFLDRADWINRRPWALKAINVVIYETGAYLDSRL